jgi:hypothetical protein
MAVGWIVGCKGEVLAGIGVFANFCFGRIAQGKLTSPQRLSQYFAVSALGVRAGSAVWITTSAMFKIGLVMSTVSC